MVGRMKGLAKSKRIFTVDDDEYDDGTAAATYSGSENEVSDGEDDAELRQRPPSSLRVRNTQFDDTDPAYEGKVVRRSDLNSDDEDDLEQAMQEEWSEGEPFAESDDDGDDQGSKLDEEEEQDDLTEDENEGDSNDEDDSDAGGDNDGDVDDMIRSLQEEDAAVLMRAKDIETQQHKAKHVYHQKMVWERCLELQICIKQLVTTMNGLGISGSDEESAKRAALASTLKECMASLHELQQKMYTVPEFPLGKKRALDTTDVWEATAAESAHALPLYQAILNKHARQAEGAAQKKFKAVNQDVLVQVDAVLADPQRIRRKAHPVADDATDSEALDDAQYDDREFYQQLLKEYIEASASADASLSAGLKLKRKKKVVNRKASKGRVVKYTVMPKLQHFMFPDPTLLYKTNMDVDELFRSLFSSTAR
ncbi:hypothetical protein ACHHYP_01498 [Achlya hypogyna]|uniref:Apoptosis antagonizing transcription factor n=1 Tax=Achlya hypogyna TaxID=1202772 RepID=A0A1V9ZTA9_ACHHY|nr:hypothetical protein ACHHYP_01498 [Achlya hypogyna]